METSTGLQGTFAENRRKVERSAPDALVYLNGQLTLPSGATPGKRINIQPLVTDLNISLGVEQSPGNANISLHIPSHYKEDFFRAGQLLLTNMMEVKIYLKGQFLVGGAPRYYPAFWGITTSTNWSWSGGQRTVSLSCQDILYWWTIQRIAVNASHQGAGIPTIGSFNTKGNGIFTGSNPYDIIYTLSRQAYGDAVIEQNYQATGRQALTEPNPEENTALMAYWQKQWGRIAFALRMYGPRGDLLQGDLLENVLSEKNAQASRQGREGSAARNQTAKFEFGPDTNFSEVAAFSEVLSRVGDIDLFTSEFQTKKEIADTTKDVIGYELFMDTTGEIVFKPPFYNLDVIPNKPVSWIRPIDIISESFAENEPNATFLEGTGNMVRNLDVGAGDIVKPRATYIDYRLVQKYGWRPGSYNSEFIGAGKGGSAPRNLFYHLVDHLDRENSRIHSGDVTIPLRPELRLGYPVYYEDQDCYWYIDSISHQFSYGSQCSTTLTLMARRSKFYANFSFWDNDSTLASENGVHEVQDVEPFSNRTSPDNQPPLGATANPNVHNETLHNRPIDARSGDPVPDRNVILMPMPMSEEEQEEEGRNVGAFDEVESEETEAERVTRDLVSFRTQFRIFGPNEFAYMIDPNRDERLQYNETGQKISGPVTSIRLEPIEFNGQTRIMPIMPISDERGYEVLGTYEYGRTTQLTRKGFDFTRQGSRRAKEFASMGPEHRTMGSGEEQFATNEEMSERDRVAQVDPNNYGRRLLDVRPLGPSSYNYAEDARSFVKGIDFGEGQALFPESDTSFSRSSHVARWQSEGMIEEARQAAGVTAEQYPDALILSIIHTESAGNAGARRTNDNGELSEYCGLMQIGNSNAASRNKQNTDFLPQNPNDPNSQRAAGVASIEHFIRYSERQSSSHRYDPDRIAINWKGGPGTLANYNQLTDAGQDSAAVGLLSEFHNTDVYIARIRSARSTWGDSSATVVERPPPAQDDINTFGIPPEDGNNLDINRDSNKLFGAALAENLRDNINSLPSGIRPVRDPGLMHHIIDFLKAIYQEGFIQEKDLERELRGETRQRVRVPDQVSRSTSTPTNNNLVDSPLTRQEIQTALDRGESISDIFGPEGRWSDVENSWRQSGENFNETKTNFGESFSSLSPFSNDEDDEE